MLLLFEADSRSIDYSFEPISMKVGPIYVSTARIVAFGVTLVMSAALTWFLFGVLLIMAAIIWYILRVMKGLKALSAGLPPENPQSWLF
jgi:uncharacterized membrane protein